MNVVRVLAGRPRHQSQVRMPNNPICTHLSNQILSSQSCFGIFDPGIVSRNTDKQSQQTAGMREGLGDFNEINFGNISSSGAKVPLPEIKEPP